MEIITIMNGDNKINLSLHRLVKQPFTMKENGIFF